MKTEKRIAAFACAQNGMPYVQMLEAAKNLGFGGLELYRFDDLKTPDLDVAKGIAQRAAELEMNIPCLSMGVDLSGSDQSEQVELVKQYILVAETAGAPYIHFTTAPYMQHKQEFVPLGKLIRRIAPAVKALCDFAAEHHVICVVEGHGYYMNGIEPLERLLETVEHPNLGVVADLGNLLCVDEQPERFVSYFAPIVHHVHIKDMVVQPTPTEEPGVRWVATKQGSFLHRTELGTGVVDIARNLRILAAAGYQGSFSIENNVIGREEKAAQDRKYLSGLVEDIFG